MAFLLLYISNQAILSANLFFCQGFLKKQTGYGGWHVLSCIRIYAPVKISLRIKNLTDPFTLLIHSVTIQMTVI